MQRSPILPVIALLALLGPALPVSAQYVSVHPPTAQPSTEIFDVEIRLDAQGRSVMGVEASIKFEETIVELQQILPGGWFTEPPADQYFFWDYTHAGTELIHFAGSSLGQALAVDGTLAICRFRALSGGICPLEFLGLTVRDGENNRLPATNSSGDRILIDAVIPTGSPSLDSIKALYR